MGSGPLLLLQVLLEEDHHHPVDLLQAGLDVATLEAVVGSLNAHELGLDARRLQIPPISLGNREGDRLVLIAVHKEDGGSSFETWVEEHASFQRSCFVSGVPPMSRRPPGAS